MFDTPHFRSAFVEATRHDGRVAMGLAWSPDIGNQLDKIATEIDYIELSYEQLKSKPELLEMIGDLPIILHCASLSIGGFVLPDTDLLKDVVAVTKTTKTPWLGEHLAFITADSTNSKPTNIGFTLCPQLSEETLDQTCKNIATISEQLSVPLLLENPPQYFKMPGSTMDLPVFIERMCERTNVSLLVDLTHLFIAGNNMGWDPMEALDRWPLDRVVEVHLSGANYASGRWWDNHAMAASSQIFELLDALAQNAHPSAITMEYNWIPHVSSSFLHEQIARVRETSWNPLC